MIDKIKNIFIIPELRQRVLFTLGVLIVVRIGAFIPIPGVDGDALSEAFEQFDGGLFGLFNTFGKAAAFIGPALIGIFLAVFKDTTLMLLPLLILFVLGIVVLYFVDTDEVI